MKEFWVIVSENNEASWGLIAKCGELARERGLPLRAYRVPSGGPEHTESVRKTLEAMYYQSRPEAVIFERSEFLAAVAPAFAAVIGCGITADCTRLCWDYRYGLVQIRPTFGGRKIAHNISVTPPYIATVRPGIFISTAPPDNSVPFHSIAPPEADNAFALLSTSAEPSGTVDLTSARIIFSGGMGLRTKENFEKLRLLAQHCGAELGASRAAVAAGFADYCHQVGQTGSTVQPGLYVAFGISGAVQHLSGITGAKEIVAINIDPKAPIRDYADLFIRADAGKFIDAMLEKY